MLKKFKATTEWGEPFRCLKPFFLSFSFFGFMKLVNWLSIIVSTEKERNDI